MNRIVITVCGGLVQTVHADDPETEVIVVDEDVPEEERTEVTEMPKHQVY